AFRHGRGRSANQVFHCLPLLPSRTYGRTTIERHYLFLFADASLYQEIRASISGCFDVSRCNLSCYLTHSCPFATVWVPKLKPRRRGQPCTNVLSQFIACVMNF